MLQKDAVYSGLTDSNLIKTLLLLLTLLTIFYSLLPII